MDIKYNVLKYEPIIGNTRLELNIKGSEINHIIMNTLRRIILTFIPIYAFTDFNIKKNKSIFNGNYLKLRLKNIPVWGIENNIEIFSPTIPNQVEQLELEPEPDEYVEADDVELNNKQSNLNSSTLNQLTMFVDYTSTSKEIVTVTTDHAKFYYSEKKNRFSISNCNTIS